MGARNRSMSAATVQGAVAYPAQDLNFDPWPVLADPAQCCVEIGAGDHDAHLAILEHVAHSQGIELVRDVAAARRAALGG